MGFWTYIGNGFRTLGFKKEAVQEIISDSSSKKNAFILLSMLAVLSGLFLGVSAFVLTSSVTNTPGLASFFPPGVGLIGGFIIGFIAVFAFTLIGYGITHLLARLFGGQNGFMQFFAVALSSSIAIAVISLGVFILARIPILGILLHVAFGIYAFIIFTFCVRESYQLSTGKAVAVVLIPLVLLLLLFAATGAFSYFTAVRVSSPGEVSNGQFNIPSRCSISPEFSCDEYTIKRLNANTAEMDVVLTNLVGGTIDFNTVSGSYNASSQFGYADGTTASCTFSPQRGVTPNSKAAITCTMPSTTTPYPDSGKAILIRFDFQYRELGRTFWQPIHVDMLTTLS